jgi:hypothetical protein
VCETVGEETMVLGLLSACQGCICLHGYDGRETSESSLLLSEQDNGEVDTDILSNSELSKPRMLRPTNEVSLLWYWY